MNAILQGKIKAVEMKSDLQKKLAYKFKKMPSSMSYTDKIHKVARSGRLGEWWKSLPGGD